MSNTRDSIGDQETLDGLINRTLTQLEEDGVTALATSALTSNISLTKVVFPNLTSTGNYAFNKCTGFTAITGDWFPELVNIGNMAFANCNALVSAVFPKATSVASDAFNTCSNLETIEFSGVNPVAFQTTAFKKCYKLNALILRSTTMSTLGGSTGLDETAIERGYGAVYVPDGMVFTYKANSNWKKYFIAPISSYPLSDFSSISDSWNEIITACSDGTYSSKYAIGDTKMIDFGIYGKHHMEIVAIDADAGSHLTWISKTILTKHKMNTSSTTTGGWQSSGMRSWLASDIKPLMPEAVRNGLVSVSKVQSTYENGSLVQNGQTTTDDLWIPSEHEINGSTIYETTGPVYSTKFNNNSARVKKQGDGTIASWLLRSVLNGKSFRSVSNNGGGSSAVANIEDGVVIGFCT